MPDRLRRRSFCILAFAAAPLAAQTDTFPARPLRLLVPFPPGGPHDITARLVGEELARRLGQAVVVENRPGAGGNVGAESAARSPADGYTLFWAQAATHGVNPSIYRRIGYDPVRDFAAVGLVGQAPLVILTHPRSGLRTLADVLARARSQPDALAFASGGNGSSPHVAGELLKSMAGVRIRHIPYKGSAAALNDTIAGHVDLVIDGIQSAQAFMRSGQLVALGVSTRERLPEHAQLPTIAEVVPGFEAVSWSGVVAPAGTPEAVVGRLNRELNAALDSPMVRERFRALQLTPTGSTPEQMDRFVRQEVAKWKKVSAETGISVD